MDKLVTLTIRLLLRMIQATSTLSLRDSMTDKDMVNTARRDCGVHETDCAGRNVQHEWLGP